MRKTWIILILYIAIAAHYNSAVSQSPEEKGDFMADVNGSFEIGWWVYYKGMEPDSLYQLGWDRTDSRNTTSIGFDLWYRIRRLYIGLGTNFNAFLVDKMEEFEDQVDGRRRYAISDRAVTYVKYYGQLEYAIFQSSKYDFNIHGRFGGFSISTTHPESDNFGRRTFYELGISNYVHFKSLTLIIRPKYSDMTIRPIEETYPGEIHKLRSYGISAGLRYWFGKQMTDD
jgi:hypothetical protein